MPTEHPCGQGPCLDWDDHKFTEVYYGHQCEKCGLFYAFGCAPWEDRGEVEQTLSGKQSSK